MTAATSDLTFSKEKERLEDILITPVEAIGRDLTAGGRIDRWGGRQTFSQFSLLRISFSSSRERGLCVSFQLSFPPLLPFARVTTNLPPLPFPLP